MFDIKQMNAFLVYVSVFIADFTFICKYLFWMTSRSIKRFLTASFICNFLQELYILMSLFRYGLHAGNSTTVAITLIESTTCQGSISQSRGVPDEFERPFSRQHLFIIHD